MKAGRHTADAKTRFTIAIVEDDESMGDLLASWVGEMGHTAVQFTCGGDLLRAIGRPTATNYSLFLLDWGLPDIDGIELMRILRAPGGTDAPIIFCTARGGEADVVEALNAGADDFIVKPVRRHELAARVAATLRRTHPRLSDKSILSVPPFSIDLVNRVFRVDGRAIALQNLEYALAVMLFQNLNGVVPRARIIQSLWGSEPMETSRTLDTHVSRIRRKLGLSAERGVILQSVYGLGYRLQVVATPPSVR